MLQGNKKLHAVAIGRACIDLNANEINRPMEQTMTFTKYVGGSPANIAIGLARLGLQVGFIGKLSKDQMGRFIYNYFQNEGISTDGLVYDDSGAVTGLAFTEIISPSDCSILMYRDNVADLLLNPLEVNEQLIADSEWLFVSGTALAKSPSREAVFVALDFAKKYDTKVAFDLDYRPYTWVSDEETAVYYNLVAEKSHIIIGTREEFNMMEDLLQSTSNDETTAQKWFDYQAEVVVIKHGGKGSIAYSNDGEKVQSGIYETEVLKTFGAGDSYASAFLARYIQGDSLKDCMKYGSASASIVISRHSCSDAMPTMEELQEKVDTGVYIQ
jgi:5-dehydro-2-deoxygluconokinase